MNTTTKIIDQAKLQKKANSIARQGGWHRATQVVYGYRDAVLYVEPAGWVENRSGQYVPKAYVNKAFSHCSYKHLLCRVEVNVQG